MAYVGRNKLYSGCWLSPDHILGNTAYCPWLRAPATLWMRSSLFRDVTLRGLVVSFRRFGTTYWSHFQGSRWTDRLSCTFIRLNLEDGTNRLSRNVCK